jgi:hypothetical protein
MIDIVTVVFKEELEVLKLQAESIELYCQDMGLDRIYVIINDDGMTAGDIDPEWWGNLADRVVVIHRQVWNINYVENGWLTQQLLKVLASANSDNTWTMVLDAKTILIQPVELNKLFDQRGRLTWGYCPVFPVFEPARQIVSHLFGINQRMVAGPAGVPFFFHTGTVRSMIRDLELRTKKPFADWFQQQGMVTEFILYSGYVEYRDGSLDLMFTNDEEPYHVCNVCHNEVEDFDRKFFEMMDPTNLTVSIHRGAWTHLTEIQQQAYRNFLIAHGITRAKEL